MALTPEVVAQSQKSAELNRHSEAIERLTRWTVPSVELDGLIQVGNGKSAIPMESDVWILHIAEVARVRADSQNEEGERLGYYPEGKIVKGAYMYNPPPEMKTSKRKYKPELFPEVESALVSYFPQTAELLEFARLVEARGRIAMEDQADMDSSQAWKFAEAWSRVGQGFFADEMVVGYKRIESHFGWPVVVFAQPEDLYRYQPYPTYKVPENIQAVSFVANPLSVPKPGEIMENTPFVACVDGCPADVLEQHIRTQLMFAQAVDGESATPVLISKRASSLKEMLEMTIKNHVLSLSLRETGVVPLNWQRTSIVQHAISQAKSELFTQKRRQSPVKRPYYIGDQPERFETGPNFEKEITEWVEGEMKEAFASVDTEEIGATDKVPLMSRARELWLWRMNFFSFFPVSRWSEVAEMINNWDGRHALRRSYRIPWEILHSNSRETQERQVPAPIQNQVVEPEATEGVPADLSQIDQLPSVEE